MNELHYQVDLLKAMNQKLSEKERMYRLMFQTTDGAYLYFSYEKKQIVTLGKWHSFFDFEIQEPRFFKTSGCSGRAISTLSARGTFSGKEK